jgi:hypothetical protein
MTDRSLLSVPQLDCLQTTNHFPRVDKSLRFNSVEIVRSLSEAILQRARRLIRPTIESEDQPRAYGGSKLTPSPT